MIERRNFYRILHVQPDASMAVIQENYRLLRQKLKIHPNLSGVDWNENLLEAAYQTLSNSSKRSAYDAELLRYYHIDTLTHGAFSSNTNESGRKQTNSNSSSFGLKNYYRVLQVQSDAPVAIIMASYQALKKHNSADIKSLDEAYRILSNNKTRQQYDVYLARYLAETRQESEAQSNEVYPMAMTTSNSTASSLQPYQAVILHYCAFCKTPYRSHANLYGNENCLECNSPITSIEHESLSLLRRTMKRIPLQGEFLFYLFWPGKPYRGYFQDLSSNGLRFWSEQSIDLGEIIKIDAANLQAVTEVTHTSVENNGISTGTRFITAKFDQSRGNFISVQA
ncbi:MAG TPA: DnaJ domain-containing protein [Nitrosomonas sp.]|nr:DnaJ domain-containing protein [Nitrosomonas sp.]HQX13075.1 DnaJ domain-containing protein [Nitrosomonas sp.]HRB20510.1 DnaJ domain-containing protein [Nitrosomonas sp.]HRB32735.1 DnaJ domain-containing protein [Nitrosomonas sp.]HRB45134.1 DnaJ domain-containing protein [Nitrosomonas sp.]